MKQCTKCKTSKGLENFSISRNTKDGLAYRCFDCTRQLSRDYAKNNRQNAIERAANYYEENKEHCKKYRKEWAQDNKEKVRSSKSKYRKDPKNKQKILARGRLNDQFRYGKLRKRNVCEICLASDTHCHHDDYTKPLEYIELCRKCHAKLHEQYKEQGISIPI